MDEDDERQRLAAIIGGVLGPWFQNQLIAERAEDEELPVIWPDNPGTLH